MSESGSIRRATGQDLCPSFLAAMEILGKRWNGMLIQAIGHEELRFVDARRRLPGISDAMLTARLQELLGCEIVEQRPAAPSSPRAVYALTAKGRALLPVLDDLTAWSERWVPVGAHGSADAQTPADAPAPADAQTPTDSPASVDVPTTPEASGKDSAP